MSIKSDVYNLLVQTFSGTPVTVRQSNQGVESALPAVTFQGLNISNNRDLDGEIYSREVSVQIDVWSHSSPETSQLEDTVEEAMRAAGWGMSGSQDVPDEDRTVYHKMLTFDTIRT